MVTRDPKWLQITIFWCSIRWLRLFYTAKVQWVMTCGVCACYITKIIFSSKDPAVSECIMYHLSLQLETDNNFHKIVLSSVTWKFPFQHLKSNCTSFFNPDLVFSYMFIWVLPFFLLAPNIAHINCGNCHTTLMYPYGAPSVKCAVCQYITNVNVSTLVCLFIRYLKSEAPSDSGYHSCPSSYTKFIQCTYLYI